MDLVQGGSLSTQSIGLGRLPGSWFEVQNRGLGVIVCCCIQLWRRNAGFDLVVVVVVVVVSDSGEIIMREEPCCCLAIDEMTHAHPVIRGGVLLGMVLLVIQGHPPMVQQPLNLT